MNSNELIFAHNMLQGEVGVIFNGKDHSTTKWMGGIVLCLINKTFHAPKDGKIWVLLNKEDVRSNDYFFDGGGIRSLELQVLLLGPVDGLLPSMDELVKLALERGYPIRGYYK